MRTAPTFDEPRGAALQSGRASRVLLSGMAIWVVGAQFTEAVAITGAAIVAAALLYQASRVRFAGAAAWAREWAPVLVFVAWGVLVTLARGQVLSSGALARHLDWLWVPVACAGYLRLDGRARRVIALTAAITLVVSCLAAALQYFGWWIPQERMTALEWTGLTFYRVYEPAPGAEGRFLAGGLLFHRLKFSTIGGLAAIWALAIGLKVAGRARAAALVLCGAALLSVLVFPFARAAAVAVVVAMGVALLLERKHRRVALGLGAAFVAVLVTVVALDGPFRQRLLSAATTEGSGARQYLLEAGLSAVRAHPLLGTGIGRFRLSDWVADDAPQYVREHGGKAHNIFVSTAAEQGLIGLALLVVALVFLARRMRPHTAEGTAGLASLAFLLLLGLLHDPLFHAETSLAFALCFGVAIGGTRRAPA